MTLQGLVNIQGELEEYNSAKQKTLEQIRLAQQAQLGEIIQAVKWGVEDDKKRPAWAFDTNDKQPRATSHIDLAASMVILLQLVLLELLTQSSSGKINQLDEDAFSKSYTPKKWTYHEKLLYWQRIFTQANLQHKKLEAFWQLSKTLGVSRDELEWGYFCVARKHMWRHKLSLQVKATKPLKEAVAA